MALKGKKKSRSRGSQARRRPAGAPRPVAAPRRRPPWYRTPGGRLIAGALLIVVIGLAIWATVGARTRAAEAAERREELEDYTGQVQSFVQQITGPAGAMSIASQLSGGELANQAKGWSEQLSGAQGGLAAITAPEELEPVNSLIQQSVLLYAQAAQGFEVAGAAEGDIADRLKTQATATWASANSVFDGAVDVLDDERAEVDLDPTGLNAPGTSAPPTGPAVTPGAGAEVQGGDQGKGERQDERGNEQGGEEDGGKGNG